jgi:hypothetical protein
MKKLLYLFVIICVPQFIFSQKTVAVISPCGGVDSVIIPTIIDNDYDGMDDVLEQKLLNTFMPTVVQFNNESCPGPALNGTGDSNLIVCHIYPYPQQYTNSSNLDSVKTHPQALVPKHGVVTGLIWYAPLIKVNTAVLYGQDCGLAGHTADVEGFEFSIKYIGTDSAAGWMYDLNMQNWAGAEIQTTSHAGTLCEQVETYPYKSAQNPNGLDTVYASPDKHGNYLTISGCGASIICNPGCGGTQIKKNVKNINLGEPNAPLVTDLGNIYPAYTGNDPWSTTNFLNTQGGNAGAIRDKMIKPLTAVFAQGNTIASHSQICTLYNHCFGNGHTDNITVCPGNTYTFFGQQLSLAGTYYHLLSDSYACDSMITLHLNVAQTNPTYYTASICAGSTYSFNGQQIGAAGTYSAMLVSSFGCDSTIYVTLSVDSAIRVASSITKCSGDTFNFNGQPLSTGGVFTDTLTAQGGCDSIVTLHLSFSQLPVLSWNNSNDTVFIGQQAILLNSVTPAGGTYSGIGVYNNTFYPDSAGEGTFAITYAYTDSLGCSNSISKNFTVENVSGINANSNTFLLNLFVSNNFLYLQRNNCQVERIQIFSVEGKMLTEIKNIETNPVDLSNWAKGMYVAFIKVQSNSCNFVTVKKFVR